MSKNGEKRNIEQILSGQPFLIQPVHGDSMMPMLDQYTDTVRLVSADRMLSEGDLPLYRRPDGKLVLHRILSVGPTYYITRGDNRDNKEKVPKSWIVAVVDGFYKKGRFIPASDHDYLSYVSQVLRSGKTEYGINEQYTVDLYMASLNDQTPPEPSEWVSWNAVWLLCKNNSIVHTVFISIKKLKNQPPEKIIRSFDQVQADTYEYEKQFKEEAAQKLKNITDKKIIRDIVLYKCNATVECIEKNKIKNKGRFKYLVRLFLPSFAFMKLSYPCLWNFPFLLPVLWIHRMITSLSRKSSREKAFRILKVLKTLK